MRLIKDRFEGHILGVGTTSGVRLVIGRWDRSPLGTFTDAMIAERDGRRVLLVPTPQIAEYVAATYSFDEVVIDPMEVMIDRGSWNVRSGELQVELAIGPRTRVGHLLRLVPAPIAASPIFASLVDPIARRVFPGVRTRGSAGGGRREYYGARDQRRVISVAGRWRHKDLGSIARLEPAPRFGFSSTPPDPSLTRVVTTVARPPS